MRRISILCAVVVLANACGGKSPTNPGNTGGNNNGGNNGSTSNAISVVDNSFDPSSTTLAAGATVTWTWNGSLNHNVTFDNTSIGNSPTQSTGTFSKTFSSPGTFNYHCTVHGTGMSGQIKIQ